jgi:flagellar biosynthesis/type III secretory pathway M-ring protein FliF/YscJ
MEMAGPQTSEQDRERMAQREAIAKLAKGKPDEVAQLIKTWLSEE